MARHRFGFALILSLINAPLFAQNYPHYSGDLCPNLSIGVYGSGSVFSLSYEFNAQKSGQVPFVFALGMGYNEEFLTFTNRKRGQYLTIPHRATILAGSGNHYFEVGLGATALIGSPPDHYYIYPIMGWRFDPGRNGNVNFRLFANFPFQGNSGRILFIPFGLSLGILLK